MSGYEGSNRVYTGRLTNGHNIQNKWNSYSFPAPVADNPTPPNLHQPYINSQVQSQFR
jgi:hypothetical protein